MHIKEVNECFDHKITGGTEFQWKCFGHNAQYLFYQSDHASASVIYDTETQFIYYAEIEKKVGDSVMYRFIDKDHFSKFKDECVITNVEVYTNDMVHLETEQDFLDKAYHMFRDLPFDPRVEVPVDLDNDTILHLALEAHKRDITLNKMVEIALLNAMERHQSTER